MTDEHKKELLKLAEEYFITYNGVAVDVVDGGDKVLLLEMSEVPDYHTIDWKDFERQVIKNNGQISDNK